MTKRQCVADISAEGSGATGRNSDKFMLRLPAGMRDRLTELAAKNRRSINAEINARLEDSIDEKEGPVDVLDLIGRLRCVAKEQGLTLEIKFISPGD